MEEHARKAQELLKSSRAVKASEELREQLFQLYGFTETARRLIREKSQIIVLDPGSTAGGGFWWPPNPLAKLSSVIELFTAEHQGGVHELSHVWWESFRRENTDTKRGLALDTVRLADLNSKEYAGCEQAIALADNYVYGRTFAGMYPKVKDVHNLTSGDLNGRVIDWEIYAGLCSFMMGQFRYGPRQLPPFMWKYFEPMFTGIVDVKPYYIGGHP